MSVNNVIVVSDLHCGCRLGLCPPRIHMDGGGTYEQGAVQRLTWQWWNEFWDEWVPRVTRGEDYAVVVNGDAVDGAHHNSKSQISQNFADQHNIAMTILRPIVEKCQGRFYMVRGTEAHVGQGAENEERLAQALGAVQNRAGEHTFYEIWMKVGHGVAHFSHHIGSTGRAAYETSALMAELMEMYVEASKWREIPPDIVVRSHRHRHIKVEVPTENTYGTVFTTPGWQGKTGYVMKIPGGRTQRAQMGGALIRCGDEELYTRHFTRSLPRPPVEVIE